MADNSQSSEGFQSGAEAVGAVYAKALLGAATNAGCRGVVLEELASLVDDVLVPLPQFAATLASPLVPHETKVQMLEKSFGGKMNATLLTFLKVVSQHGRLGFLKAMRREAVRLDNEECGRVEAQVVTAEPMTPELLDQVRTQLAAKLGREVVLNAKVDPQVLGGLVIRVGDTVYDGSLANQLQRVRRETLEQAALEIRQSISRFATEESTAS
ncbi:ATP synthase F1 subunit delta [Lignipirellula cremea]|uniref:ATP synthase subunit delta n=1 Tax=Lignipirellula cremea TaxID=2528010 RepID=A0A518E367_9BACT|nr:ATP synthase F1 subunit delta [Lignipirellula cremea]QDU98540.1 ATP synthase subunit delta, sodium ion specific [Lignipirellula cremea]